MASTAASTDWAISLNNLIQKAVQLEIVWYLAAILIALIAGFAAGCCTAFIHLRFRIHTLLAGILMMTMLYSINLRIMGRANGAQERTRTFTAVKPLAPEASASTNSATWARPFERRRTDRAPTFTGQRYDAAHIAARSRIVYRLLISPAN